MVRVSVGDRVVALAPGEELPFGRSSGPGQISESTVVSSVHGVVRAEADRWEVTSTGRYHGFTVLDVETPSRLVVPVGAGPVVVPFARAVILVEVEHHRYLLEVDASSAGASNWTGSWVSFKNREPFAPGNGSDTAMAWRRARFIGRDGQPLRWYLVLVALCEPRLRLPAATREDRIPSNREIANRLKLNVRVIENHHLDRLRTELGFPPFSAQTRLGAVLLAISQGLVTTADLALLPPETAPLPIPVAAGPVAVTGPAPSWLR